MADIAWQPIREAHLHGYGATLGNRRVEVVRAFSNDWRVYRYENDTMVRDGGSYDAAEQSRARANAARWLREEA